MKMLLLEETADKLTLIKNDDFFRTIVQFMSLLTFTCSLAYNRNKLSPS